jgi:hypothetical protein
LGYKLYQSGPYDPSLCAAACDSQVSALHSSKNDTKSAP